jgi:hypothetical protein
MNVLKKILGVVWLLLAVLAAYFCIVEFGIPKFTTGSQDDLVFGIIILFILTPLIVIGLAIFGIYAIKGEYDD